MSNKEIYTEWTKTQERLPIFLQPWWMDAVCAGKEWDVVLVERQKTDSLKEESSQTAEESSEQAEVSMTSAPAPDEHPMSTRSAPDEHPMTDKEEKEEKDMEEKEMEMEIVAAMPYLFRKKWWMKWIIMPQETQIGGIWLNENHEFTSEELTSVCKEIADKLAEMKLHYYYQQFPVGSPCPDIFRSLGFKIKERVTYRIDNLIDLDKVIDRFSKNKKRQLQKALSLHAENKITAEEFYALHHLWLSMQKKKISYSREFLLVLEQKLRKHNQSQILTICNPDHEPYAAALLVWDSQRMYYLIPCFNPDYKESGAGALLVLEAIKLAREKGVSFDFEGSMIRGVAQHYKQFGSLLNTYYSVEKYYKWWFCFALFWNWLRSRKYN